MLAFSPCTGAVAIQRECKNDVVILDTLIDDEPISAIITGMTLEMSGNYQFLHTLNDLVYFYSFGDRVGSLILTGIGFTNPCNYDAYKGSILRLYEYYMNKRAVKSGGKAMSIVLETGDGEQAKFWGFLTGMRVDVSDGQAGPMGYWTLRFEVLPQK